MDLSARPPRRTEYFRLGMDRTPLFAALRRNLRLAQLASHAGQSSGAASLERQEEARRTRREALKLSALSALTWAGGHGTGLGEDVASPPLSKRASAPRVVIVGAGIAGLSAAYHLKRAGIRARLFEAGKRVGGRIFSVKNLIAPGLVTEFGGEFIDSQHEDMLGLAKRFGLTLVDMSTDLGHGLAREAYFFGGTHHSEVQAIDAFLPLARRMEDDAEDLGSPWRYRNNPDAIELDRCSIAEYLDKIGAKGWIRSLIDVAFAAEFGLDCDHLSAIDLLTLISTDMTKGRFELYGESDERYKIVGGNQQIIKALANEVEGQIDFEHPLVSLSQSGSAFRLDFDGPQGRSTTIEADFVVLAIPFSTLRQVELRVELPALKKRAIAEIGYGTNTKLVAGFQRRVWRKQGYAGAIFTDEPFATAWDHTRLQESEAGGLTIFPGGKAGLDLGMGTAASQLTRLLSSVDRVYPGSAAAFNGRVDRYHWPSAPFAWGSYACYKPGQWTSFAGVEGTPVGNLFFAGEHCRFNDSGFMDSGAASGRRTAKSLLGRINGR